MRMHNQHVPHHFLIDKLSTRKKMRALCLLKARLCGTRVLQLKLFTVCVDSGCASRTEPCTVADLNRRGQARCSEFPHFATGSGWLAVADRLLAN